MTRKALLLGATGLVGRHCLKLLLGCGAYQEVRVLTRRPLGMEAPGLSETVIDLQQLDSYRERFQVEDVFCALGTTLKRAGSRSAFRNVDEHLVVAAAELARDAGAQRMMVVSAAGANPRAAFFYSRVKGSMEQRLEALELPFLAFMQPSLLIGERAEYRPGEALGMRLSTWIQPFTRGSNAAWLPVPARRVARAMVGVALLGPATGTYRLRYRDIAAFSERFGQHYPQCRES